MILLHSGQNPSSAIWITEIIKMPAGSTCILKPVRLTPPSVRPPVQRQQFRGAYSAVRVRVHPSDERGKPIFTYQHIGIKKKIVLRVYPGQSLIISSCKTLVLPERNLPHLRILLREQLQRAVRRSAVGHIKYVLTSQRRQNPRNESVQILLRIPIQYDYRSAHYSKTIAA